MHCPACDQPDFDPTAPCPQCQFSGDPALVEELAHVDWVLDQIGGWPVFNEADRQSIRQHYAARQRELEINLGLRLPPFTDEQAAAAWPELVQREALLQYLAEWLEEGSLQPPAAQTLVEQVKRQIKDLLEQLEGRARPALHQTDFGRLDLIRFLLEAVDHLSQKDGFATPEAHALVRSRLEAQQEHLEINLGLRPAPAPEPQPAPPEPEPAPPAPPPAPPAAPPLPFRDRLLRTLLSVRTLQALLFLGIFLTFSAALSFVAWGWRDFSAPLRVAIPTGFTALFFAMGWYVRTRTPLYRSGIALSAIASLLIPIDFYTLYANLNISADYGPSFWLLTSLACLAAYIVTTLIIQNPLFGYLVGVAAGSTVLALIQVAHQALGFSLDWRTAGLSALALCFTVLSARRSSPRLPRVFADPLRALALLAMGVLMPLSFGWRYIGRSAYDTLHYAMTINWWVGGFIFGWGAVYHRSRSLGILAAMTLPIATYMAQAALFDWREINPAWHAFGWACLVPLYFVVGHRLLARKEDTVLYGHGRTATGWGAALLIAAALWSLTEFSSGAAAACSHAVLAGSVVLATRLWRRPAYLYGASLLSFSALTFALTELNLNLSQLTPGWAALAIAHMLIAIRLRDASAQGQAGAPSFFATPLVTAAYALAALAIAQALAPYDGDSVAYVLGNWLGLAAWGAWLAHTGQPGFAASPPSRSTFFSRVLYDFRRSRFHWFTALPLPVWLWVLFSNRGPLDSSFPIALAVLAWGLGALSYRLERVESAYGLPWYLMELLVSIAAPLAAWLVAPEGFTPALCLLAVGLLYFADAAANRQTIELLPGGLVTAWGLERLLDKLRVSFDATTLILALLVAAYILGALWIERKKSPVFTHRFLIPLYLSAHLISLAVLWRIYVHPINDVLRDIAWTDEMRAWGAAGQIVLGIVYGLYAWGIYKEHWAHAAAWLLMGGGGFVAIAYSQGRGSSAAKGALAVIAFILAERALHWLRGRPLLHRTRRTERRWQAIFRLAWRLYRRPLLASGWIASAGVIGLALVRNLWLLGGGRIQQTWAAIGLALITGLYALSARLFRQARFVWMAAVLVFAPWTILTNLGWFVLHKPTTPGFALSWVVLAWALFLVGLLVQRATRPSASSGHHRIHTGAYALPLRTVAHVLLPLSLLWGIADVNTSRITFALAIGFYTLAAILDYVEREPDRAGQVVNRTKFLYPALGLIPVWCVYVLRWLLPAARHEHYGLMLLVFGPLGVAAGQSLERFILARKSSLPNVRQLAGGYALPAYLTGYISLIVGTMLVAHQPALLALTLLYDALLALVSARIFRHPLWVYPAVALTPLSLLIALNQAGVAGNRHGWWLIGLGAVYLGLTWALRRLKSGAYSTATLASGFALIALGLPPSSQDKDGALWGYGGAALLYAVTAFWLRQPLLLTPACALAIVPYAIVIQRSPLAPDYYGLALFPGAAAALALGWRLDAGWRDFPWGHPPKWGLALGERLLNWWALPLYALGFGLTAASPLFTHSRAGLTALNLALMMPLFGWAIYRFRLRGWLLALAAAGHLAALYFLKELGWWRYPPYAWARFLPVTLAAAGAGMLIEWRREEGSPLHPARLLAGWSRPLYGLALLDVIVSQLASLGGTSDGALVTLTHALLIAALASFWISGSLPFLSTALGIVALLQWLFTLRGLMEGLPVALAQLALAYGLVGYGLAFARKRPGAASPRLWIWETPLIQSGLWLSFAILVITAIFGIDLVGWTLRAMLGFSFRDIVELETVRMIVGVLALLGLLYVGAAFTYRRVRLGYAAIGMLLAAWITHAFYVQQWDGAAHVQWYAVPAGLYLAGVAFVEWQRGNKTFSRWLDYAALALMMSSLFWQTLLFGWRYALMLGAEGFASFWWGSARRLRRFLYAGMLGVVLATVAQLINSLQSINQWIVFGLIGLLAIAAAVLIERKLEEIKAWLEVLETWE